MLKPLAWLVERAAFDAGMEVSLTFDPLLAGDVAGTKRVSGSLVKGGMGVEDAARLCGLLADED